MSMRQVFWNGLIFLILSIGLFGFGGSTSLKTIKVEAKPNSSTLYYSGIIEPLTSYTLKNINAEGVILEKYFNYGSRVEKDQILFTIVSPQLAKDYQTALTAYAKAKKSYSDVQFQVNGEEELNKLKLVSQQELMNSRSQLFNAKLDYDQATRALNEVMEKVGISKNILNHLNSSNPDELSKALTHVANKVKIISPMSGIALFPKSGGGDDSGGSSGASAGLDVGSVVKADDPLVVIHTKKGIAVDIKVNQLDISQIRYDETVLITSDAFPGTTLKAQINQVDREASKAGYGAMPTFNVKVIVPELNPKEYAVVRMGMTCEVAIQITTLPVIKVPLSAVYTKNNTAMVNVIDPKTKKTKEVPVTTGNTDLDSVEILNGLKSGDEVVLNAANH